LIGRATFALSFKSKVKKRKMERRGFIWRLGAKATALYGGGLGGMIIMVRGEVEGLHD
jgi:hypothetical protein